MPVSQKSITWIDDDFGDSGSDRRSLLRDMEARSEGALKVTPLEPREVPGWLAKVESGTETIPSLVLVDLFLRSSKAGQLTPLIFDHGTKVVGLLSTNDQLADVPKYLVSRALQDGDAKRQTDQFDWVLTHGQLAASGADLLMHDVSSYSSIRDVLSKINTTAIHLNDDEFDALLARYLSLLRVPKPSKEAAGDICRKLLTDLIRRRKSGLGAVSLDGDEVFVARGVVLDAARWVRSLLLKRSGPLVGDLLAATILGAKFEAFNTRVAPLVTRENADATYSGIFSYSESRRWWREALIDWALQRFDKLAVTSPGAFAKAVAEQLGLRDGEHAICVVCKKKWPETIARDAEDPSEWRQVHWHCSSIVDESNVPVGFDELREFLVR